MITEADITSLLLRRHKDDICVPQCKSGQSWVKAGTMKKFDLFAMKRSYSNPAYWIYEIKIARSDFLQDAKWQTYLPFCNEFYFVAPAGIIDPTEVPEQAGLLLSSKNGTRLYCKKKAPHRDVEIPDSVFKYILMSRTKIVDSTYANVKNREDMQSFWRGWLEGKDVKQQLGHHVSRKIRKLYEENIEKVHIRQEQLDRRIEKLESVEGILKEMGFDWKNLGWDYRDKVCDRIAEINEGFPEKDVVKHLNNAISNLQNTIKTIQKKELT